RIDLVSDARRELTDSFELLCETQFLLHAILGRDVARDTSVPGQRAVLEDRIGAIADPARLSVGANDPILEVVFTGDSPLRSRLPAEFAILGMHVAFPQCQRHSLSRSSPDLLERRAQVEELAIEGAHPQNLRDPRCDLVEALLRGVQRELEPTAFLLAQDHAHQHTLREIALA